MTLGYYYIQFLQYFDVPNTKKFHHYIVLIPNGRHSSIGNFTIKLAHLEIPNFH